MFDFYVWLRRASLELIVDIKDSDPFYTWNETKANKFIRSELESNLLNSLEYLKKYNIDIELKERKEVDLKYDKIVTHYSLGKIDKTDNSEVGIDMLKSILTDIIDALENAGDKMPRSGIREYLLRAILKINDQLLQNPMDEYIRRQLNIKMGIQDRKE